MNKLENILNTLLDKLKNLTPYCWWVLSGLLIILALLIENINHKSNKIQNLQSEIKQMEKYLPSFPHEDKNTTTVKSVTIETFNITDAEWIYPITEQDAQDIYSPNSSNNQNHAPEKIINN